MTMRSTVPAAQGTRPSRIVRRYDVTFHGTRHSFGTALVRSVVTEVAQKA
jgi:hypothetical protein